jgi:CarD family transcriptional regulator
LSSLALFEQIFRFAFLQAEWVLGFLNLEVVLMASEKPSFEVGDNAVYPGHGVGKVTAIEVKEIFGKKHEFYTIQILENGMKIMIPKNNVESVGLRPIISRDEAARVIEILKETNVKIDTQTWNRRYREYMEKIKTGSVFEIAEVLRDLFLLKVDKELSFGERKMLDTARGLLLKELSLAKTHEELMGEDEVKAIFGL